MARLPYVDLATVSPRVRETLERVPAPLKIFFMMAHAETNLRPLLRLGTSILTEQKLNAALRELAILRVASRTGAEYEWAQHVRLAQQLGITDDAIDAAGDAASSGAESTFAERRSRWKSTMVSPAKTTRPSTE